MPRSCLDTVKACWPMSLPPSIEAWVDLRCKAGIPPWLIWFVMIDMLRRPDRSVSEHERRLYKKAMTVLEQRPQQAEELLKESITPLDIEQWQQLLEATIKLWPDFDDAFLFVLFDAFRDGALKRENLKAWLDNYRAKSAPSLPGPP